MHGPDGLFDDPRDAIVIAITTAISSVITSTIPVSWRTGNPRIHAYAARLVTTLPPRREPGQVAIGDAAIGRSRPRPLDAPGVRFLSLTRPGIVGRFCLRRIDDLVLVAGKHRWH